MVILVISSAFIGGAITIALLWPYGIDLALFAAPFGGSLLTLAVALLVLAWDAMKRRRSQDNQTFHMKEPRQP